MKQILSFMLIILLLTSCSSKYPAMKNGAIVGGVAGAVVGGLAGSEIGGTHMGGSSSKAEAAVTFGLFMGLIGLGLGAGTGYIIDSVWNNDDEMQEIIHSQQMMEIHR